MTSIQGSDTQPGLYELQPVERTAATKFTPSWRSLFAFTTRAHWLSIVLAGSGSILAGLMKPVSSIFFGRIFSVLSKFGGGSLEANVAMHDISKWCLALTALGVSAWLAEFMFLFSWIIFGESQAKAARNKMFATLLAKDQRWYDLRDDGVGSLLVRIQT
jgi:ATP-binding cassette subfamily B (MDR/TAP) protein 1